MTVSRGEVAQTRRAGVAPARARGSRGIAPGHRGAGAADPTGRPLACGATVLASDTAPMREMIRHDENGLLADSFDIEGLADSAKRVLGDPGGHACPGKAGVAMIRDRDSMGACLPQLPSLFERAAANGIDDRARTSIGVDPR